jgi:hypothetical protein
MRNTRMDIRARLLIILLVFSFTTIAMPTVANAAACYGASCNGLDPTGRCDSDAKTVGAMNVTDGMLELRWSPSCAANWGRYTPYQRTITAYALMNPPIGIWVRITVWNPRTQSYSTAHNADLNAYASSWSQMTDGTLLACTGIEVLHIFGYGDHESQGWAWGPCR